MGLVPGIRNHAPAAAVPMWADRYGTPTAVWEADDPNITLVGSRATVIPNRYNPGTHDLTEVGGSGGDISTMGSRAAIVLDGTEYYEADTVAPALGEADTPFTLIMAFQLVSLVASDRLWSFGNSGSDTQHMDPFMNGSGVLTISKTDDVAANDTAADTNPATGGVVYAWRHTGTTIYTLINGVVEANGASLDVDWCTWDQFTIGALRRTGVSFATNMKFGAAWLYAADIGAAATFHASRSMASRWVPFDP